MDHSHVRELRLRGQRRVIIISVVIFITTPPALYIISPEDFQLPRKTLLVCLAAYICFVLWFHAALVRQYINIAREGKELTTGQISHDSDSAGSGEKM